MYCTPVEDVKISVVGLAMRGVSRVVRALHWGFYSGRVLALDGGRRPRVSVRRVQESTGVEISDFLIERCASQTESNDIGIIYRRNTRRHASSGDQITSITHYVPKYARNEFSDQEPLSVH